MKKNVYAMLVLALCAASFQVSALQPIYMDYGDIKGEVTANAAPSGGQIEIESFSWGATNAGGSRNRVQGNFIGTDASGCTVGPVKFRMKGKPSADLARLCKSRGRIGTVNFDVNGVKHSFENASFESCQTGDGLVPTDQFSLNYSKCSYHGTTHVNAGVLNAQPNARIVGLSTAPVAVHLESLTLSGTDGTMVLAKSGQGHLILPTSSKEPLPSLVVELTNGTKWEFLRVRLQDSMVSGIAGGAAKASDTFKLSFESVRGPVAGYPLR
jgi:type VI protein secretion system component Hcp